MTLLKRFIPGISKFYSWPSRHPGKLSCMSGTAFSATLTGSAHLRLAR